MFKRITPKSLLTVWLGLLILALALVPAPMLSVSAQDTGSVIEFTLRAQFGGDPAVSYVGVGGDIDGVINPELVVTLGNTVRLTLINGEAAANDLVIDEFAVSTGKLTARDETATVEFVADQAGEFNYYGTAPGFRMIGMQGILRVVDSAAATEAPETTAPAVVEFTLTTKIGLDPAMAYVGVGGDIDGIVNPELVVNLGDTVRLTVINGEPVLHDLHIDEFGVYSGELLDADQTAVMEFVADKPGVFDYYCGIPGHRQIGMAGTLRVVGTVTAGDPEAMDDSATDAGYVDTAAHTHEPAAADPNAAVIIRNPADVPAPIGDRGPEHFTIEMTTIELEGVLADGTTYRYMTFDGQVPGPMLRMRVGDTADFLLHNDPSSTLIHSIDLHAVTGPGGGAVFTQTLAGETTEFFFQALNPGLYVYHCATASIGHHISSGMYGLILVEPEGGLPPVDREFYVMQGEIYTMQPFGTEGLLDFDYEAMLDENPEYYVFNGSAGALALDEYALRANVGETVRIYFGVGGPNAISSFHVIGEIFDRVYDQASLTSAPLTDVQTTLVPPGGATVVEFKLDVPGRYILVDHALSRLERGLVGLLYVEGAEVPEIFHGESEPESSGH